MVYNIVLVSAIQQHESAISIYLPSFLKLTPLSYPILALSVVTEHQFEFPASFSLSKTTLVSSWRIHSQDTVTSHRSYFQTPSHQDFNKGSLGGHRYLVQSNSSLNLLKFFSSETSNCHLFPRLK